MMCGQESAPPTHLKLTYIEWVDRVEIMREKVTIFPLRYPALMFLRQIFFLGLAILFLSFPAGSLSAEDDQKRIPRGGCPDLIDLIKELTPVVVNISIERHLLQNTSSPPALFRSSRGGAEDLSRGKEKFQTDSLGSGFICDTAGNIVTNAHVVEGAGKILVTFSTGKVVPDPTTQGVTR